jgi:BlaI family transcriptional regulator, penicillinase repressor
MARKLDGGGEPQLSAAEWKVMRCLWRRSPASAREVREALREETGWAYTTVRTLLARLEAKGAVRSSRRGSTSAYEPLLRESQARAGALRALLERAFDGAFGGLAAFLIDDGHLSKRDRAELARRLEKARERKQP